MQTTTANAFQGEKITLYACENRDFSNWFHATAKNKRVRQTHICGCHLLSVSYPLISVLFLKWFQGFKKLLIFHWIYKSLINISSSLNDFICNNISSLLLIKKAPFHYRFTFNLHTIKMFLLCVFLTRLLLFLMNRKSWQCTEYILQVNSATLILAHTFYGNV